MTDQHFESMMIVVVIFFMIAIAVGALFAVGSFIECMDLTQNVWGCLR